MALIYIGRANDNGIYNDNGYENGIDIKPIIYSDCVFSWSIADILNVRTFGSEIFAFCFWDLSMKLGQTYHCFLHQNLFLPRFLCQPDHVQHVFVSHETSELSCYRVFIWGRRPNVSSGRLPFHVRYFEINVGDFFYYCIIYFSY